MSSRLLRKQYIHQKTAEMKQAPIYQKKRQLYDAISNRKKVPDHLVDDEVQLRESLKFDDASTLSLGSSENEKADVQKSIRSKRSREEGPDPTSENKPLGDVIPIVPPHLDEYTFTKAGSRDPRLCITTSRDPSNRLINFSKELSIILPNTTRLNRGGLVITELVEACKRNNYSDIIVLHETRGNPDAMIVSHLPFGPTAFFSLSKCVLRHDRKVKTTTSQAYPNLIFNNFSTQLGNRVVRILKCLFPVPRDTSQRVITFSNENDLISFNHHSWSDGEKWNEPLIVDEGPSFFMRLVSISLGTLNETWADYEFKLKPYHRTYKFSKQL